MFDPLENRLWVIKKPFHTYNPLVREIFVKKYTMLRALLMDPAKSFMEKPEPTLKCDFFKHFWSACASLSVLNS